MCSRWCPSINVRRGHVEAENESGVPSMSGICSDSLSYGPSFPIIISGPCRRESVVSFAHDPLNTQKTKQIKMLLKSQGKIKLL